MDLLVSDHDVMEVDALQVGERHFFSNTICIEADHSHLVQADGEVIGHTPVEIKLVLKAIHVIMPKPVPIAAAA